MKRKKRLWLTIVMTGLTFVGIGAYMAETAYAYTFYPASFQYGDLALNPENQPQVDGGSTMTIDNPGTEPGLEDAVVHAFIAHAQVVGDGQGNWQIPDLDIEGSTSNDGYPMIGGLGSESYDVNSFVSRLDGNLSYVQGYIQAHGGTTTATSFSANSTYDLVDFDTVVLTSGATMTVHNTPTGQYDSEGNQILYGQYTVTPTAPPTAESIRISDGSSGTSGTVTEGDPLDISVTSQQNVDNGAYTHHYDSVKVVSSSGTTTWLVGTGHDHVDQMEEESGSHGTLTDTLSASSSGLAPGSYTAYFYTTDAVHRPAATAATTTFTVTGSSGGSGSGGGPSITLSADPTSLTTGSASTLTAVTSGVSPNAMDEIDIIDVSGDNTLGGQNSETTLSDTTATATATDDTAQTVEYEAEIINFNSGAVLATSSPVDVTWTSAATAPVVAPTITLSADPTKLASGDATTLTYQVTHYQSGETVKLIPIQGGHIQSDEAQSTTGASGDFEDAEYPSDGASVTVDYQAYLYTSYGAPAAFSNVVSVTWTSSVPTLQLNANPTHLLPGQPSNLSYTVQGDDGEGDYVTITPRGNGSDEWTETHDDNPSSSATEIEDPGPGQTIAVTYTGHLYDASGELLSTSTVEVAWTNAWTGTLHLTANPTQLAVGDSTTLEATTTEALPSGYTLVLEDETTDTTVDRGANAPETTQYASGTATTNTFVAYVTDGFETVGTESNTVQVQWSVLALSAHPVELPAGQTSVLTVTGDNLPPGSTLTVVDQTTGQTVGTTTFSGGQFQVRETSPQSDTYVAYLSNAEGGRYATSNPETVTWYTVQLTAHPVHLAIGYATTLTAQAQNMPTGYVLDIVDTSTGRVVASGPPGQTRLETLQTETSPQTDDYVAQVVQPSNPSIPGLFVPGIVPAHGIFAIGAHHLKAFDPHTQTWHVVATVPNNDGEAFPDDESASQFQVASNAVWDGQNQTIYVYFSYYQEAPYDWEIDQIVYRMWGFNTVTGQWSPTRMEGDYFAGIPSDMPIELKYDAGRIYVLSEGMYGDESVYRYDPTTNSSSEVNLGYTTKEYNWQRHRYLYTGVYGPDEPMVIDRYNDTIYTADANYMYMDWSVYQWLYGDLDTGATGPLTAVNATISQGIEGAAVGYDSSNHWVYFYESNLAPYGSGQSQIVGYDPTTNAVQVYPMPFSGAAYAESGMHYDPADGKFYLAVNTASPEPIYSFDPSTGAFQDLGGVDDGGGEAYHLTYDANQERMYYLTNGGQLEAQEGSGWQAEGAPVVQGDALVYVPTHGAMSGAVAKLPYWTFEQMPAYVPTSLFPSPAYPSGTGQGFWVDDRADDPNGTAFFQASFQTAQTESVTVRVPTTPNNEEVLYVDGQPVLQTGTSAEQIPQQPDAPVTDAVTLTLPAGVHQVLVEGVNDGNLHQIMPNPASVSAEVVGADGQVLVPDEASAWTTTGYVTSLPPGWFRGAVGTWPFSEYVLGEQGTAVTESAAYTVETTAQTVALMSSPVSVTWYQYDLSLTASPTTLATGAKTTLTATAPAGMPSGAVIQIRDETTHQVVGTSAPNATSYTTTWSESSAQTDTFVAAMVSASGQDVSESDTVPVTWTEAPLTLSDAFVTHTPGWLRNIRDWNSWHPSDPRPLSEFWAGEELVFGVKPSIASIVQATVTINGLTYNSWVGTGAPDTISVPLTYDDVTGELEGNTNPDWISYLQYLSNGTYEATFLVRAEDNQVASVTVPFSIDNNWTQFFQIARIY